MSILFYLSLCIIAGLLVYIATKKISFALLAVLVLLMLAGLAVMVVGLSQ